MRIYYSDDIAIVKERLQRKSKADEKIVSAVKEIVNSIEAKGDKALFEYTKKFDGFDINENNIRVTEQEIKEAYKNVSAGLIDILKKSAANISEFHKLQKREGFERKVGGAITGCVLRPVQKAGVYVPGGKASYPSSVLMNIIPAKIAGVEKVIMVTPPGKTGCIEPLTLTAADIAGADMILKIGGAQAIAALAYGTKSVPRVDVITGPGNAYVAAAKREIFGTAGIDMIAGPSEVMIIADKTANIEYIASDFLSQAEHDEKAASVLLTPCKETAEKAAAEITRQLGLLPRKEIAAKSVSDYGTIVVTTSIDEAFNIANEFAPEHLEILTADPWNDIKKVKNAGCVFLGEYSPEPLGDYFAGPNHILPTSGTARFSSPLSVDDFMKKTNYVCYDKQSLSECYNDISVFAEAEGLQAHARSVLARFKDKETVK